MSIKDKSITPVILGGDLGAYSMARAFCESAGVISYVFARERLAICDTSSFIVLYEVKELDDPNVAIKVLMEFAEFHKDKRLVLIPTSDWYMETLQYSRDVLRSCYEFIIPEFELWRAVTDKASFYELLRENDIDYPKTCVLTQLNYKKIADYASKLKPPFVLKPSDSSLYWKNSFKDMRKVYFPYSMDEAIYYASQIYDSGYEGKLILQERIFEKGEFGGIKEPSASVLTTYSDKSGRVIRAVAADILLEEIYATARGNYSAMITKPLNNFCKKIIGMLNRYKYVGIANFDIISKSGESYCLELNARSGRSSDYVRAAGTNLARLIQNDISDIRMEPKFEYERCLWCAVPFKCLYARPRDKALLNVAQMLIDNNMVSSPYDSVYERSIIRKMYVRIHMRRQAKLYEKEGKESTEWFSAGF